MLAAVRQDGRALVHAWASLRDDSEVVLSAVAQNGFALVHASAALQDNREVVLAAVGQNGCALAHASAALRHDRDAVLAAVRQSGYLLAHASAALRHDKEVVLAAVGQAGTALIYASASLRASPALRALSTVDPALLAAQLRLTCALELLSSSGRAVRCGGTSLALLPADVVEVIGANLSRDAVITGLAIRHKYWACDLEVSSAVRKRRRVQAEA